MSSVIQVEAAIETNEITEALIRNLIKVSENPVQVLVGIHNAFVHGEVLQEIGFRNMGDKDHLLTAFFSHFDKAADTIKQIQDLNS